MAFPLFGRGAAVGADPAEFEGVLDGDETGVFTEPAGHSSTTSVSTAWLRPPDCERTGSARLYRWP
ncbi:hypothetical protein [Streptomyces chattanoogensis]|uniref:hypothetical protein n=1 Tax=Streptomyces chattanoogensis TaxID=66876 RepID=UPI00368961EA